MQGNEMTSTQLMLKFIRGPRASETIKFMPDDAPILIGRNFDCHIQIALDESMSRYQSRIDHINDQWILKDGNGDSHKMNINSDRRNQIGQIVEQNDSFNSVIENSTNGTWIFCNMEEELKG